MSEPQEGFGEAAMDGPNTHRMDAPSDVTSWTVIPTTRNVVTDDGRDMTLRDEWWHVPTFVVDEIERAVRAATPEEPGPAMAQRLSVPRLGTANNAMLPLRAATPDNAGRSPIDVEGGEQPR